MTSYLKEQLRKARNLENNLGINVLGVLETLRTLMEETLAEAETPLEGVDLAEAVYNTWSDRGREAVQESYRGADGHMSRLQISAAIEARIELADAVFQETETWDDIVEALTAKPDEEDD